MCDLVGVNQGVYYCWVECLVVIIWALFVRVLFL